MAFLRNTNTIRGCSKHRRNLLRNLKRYSGGLLSTDTAAIPILLAATGVALTFYSTYKDLVALYGAN